MRKVRLVLAFLLVGCAAQGGRPSGERGGAPDAPRNATPKRVVVSVTSDLPTLRSQLNRAAGGVLAGGPELEQLVHAGLTIADDRAIVQPELAEQVPSVENAQWLLMPDGRMETRWTIKPGAAWQDGTAFTASDLVFTSQVFQDPELPMFRDVSFESAERIEAPDSRTLVITWRQPYIDADKIFSAMGAVQNLPLPRHILERPFQENKAGLADHPYWGDEFVGLGPFKPKEWLRGSYLILEANDRYTLGRPKIDFIEVKFIPDPNAVIANVLAGTVELTIGPSLSFEQALEASSQWRGGRLDAWFSSVVSAWPQLMTPDPAVLGDVRFRRALLHAMDRQNMVDTLMHGRSEVAHSLMNPRYPEAREIDQFIARYPYDLRRSGEIVEGLGYQRGPDGFFRDVAGQRLVIEVRGSTVTEIGRKTAYPVADDWQRAGVGVDLIFPPPQRARDREYRATFPGVEMARGANELEGMRRFHSSNNAVPENNYAGTNRTRYVNEEFDRLIESFYVTIPRSPRIEILGRIIEHMTGNVILLSLFHDAESALVSNRLKNVAGAGGNSTQGWNAHEWDVQ